MARAKFKALIPKPLRTEAFAKAYKNAAKEAEDGMKKDFADATMFFKEKPEWTTYTKIGSGQIYISVGTTSIAFKYYDQGNGGPGRIIRPKHAWALHWVDAGGEDVFVKWVHGYEGRHVSDTIHDLWVDKLYEVFGKHIAIATVESGHKATRR
jgi:hypothetical protein